MPSSLFNNQPTTMGMVQNPTTNQNPMAQMQQLSQMAKQLQNANNPTQLLQSMAMTNPDLNRTLNQINSEYSGDPKAAFYSQAQKKGVDPNAFIQSMKQFGF